MIGDLVAVSQKESAQWIRVSGLLGLYQQVLPYSGLRSTAVLFWSAFAQLRLRPDVRLAGSARGGFKADTGGGRSISRSQAGAPSSESWSDASGATLCCAVI